MKRRFFLGLTGTAALSPVMSKFNGTTGLSETRADILEKGRRRIKTIAGYTPEELLSQYKSFLFEDFLPFMEKYVIDHELGGFLWNIDRDGTIITTHKRAWYDGRGIWVYSFLYNNFRKDPKYLETAKKAVDFVLRVKPDDRVIWPASYTREGVPVNDFPQDIYGDLFIAEGLAEFAVAAQKPEYRTMSKEILMKCLKLYDSDDYEHIIDYGPIAPVIPAPRVVGPWMVFLRTCYCLLSHEPDSDFDKVVDRCYKALMKHHYNPEFDLINEVLNHDFSRPEEPFSQFVYCGHVIETMWMFMYEAVRRRDTEMFSSAVEKFKRHLEVAWDDVYGGVFRSLDNVNDNIWKVNKVLWEQAEVLIGTLFLIEHTGDPWAYHWFDKMYKYVIDTYPLKKYGYPLWNIEGDRRVTFIKQGYRIENYHHPRHLMLNILSLERIINRGGKIVKFI